VDSSEPEGNKQRVPTWVIAIDILYVIVLAGLALWWGRSADLRRDFPSSSTGVPVTVLWWGALGAVTVSLAATTKFRDSWDGSLNAWHLSRPVVGAVLGAVVYLIFVVVIATAGASRTHASNGNLTFYLVAFLVGYREETFRQLIKRATDSLLGPGEDQEDRPSRRHRPDPPLPPTHRLGG
jgi:hypothetical protein